MSALQGISLNAKISLVVAGVIMLTFFTVQTCIVFGLCEPTLFLAKFGWGCVIFFMPPFFKVVQEFLANKAKISKDLSTKNTYLEHAAKIIRHDMHSGINTYLPRGIKSMKRRLTEEQIAELKIGAPLKLIEDGLHHAQKVYSGVYEALFCTAIDNLIRNGLKYNDSPTKWVKIGFEGDYGKDSFICIEDNGRGLTSEEFWRLSKPYARKEGQKEEGTGLGLNICVEILKQHGFEIVIEEKEIGTKIKIKI
jgi:hypothetical protein